MFENPGGGGSMRFLPNFFGEGTPFWDFIAFLLTSLVKILKGGSTLTPLRASMTETKDTL